jgi:hypothetical protein
VLAREQPDWVLYQEVKEVFGRKCMQGVVAVEPEWLPDWLKRLFDAA